MIRHFRPTHYSTPGEDTAYKHIIQNLHQKLDKRANSSLDDSYFMKPSKIPYDKIKYAEELQRQIKERRNLKELEKCENSTPAISTSFQGYPHRPATPEEIKQVKKKYQMKRIKEDLDKQLISKSMELKSFRQMNKELEKKISEENMQRLNQEALIRESQKKTHKEILIESWNFAIQTKELQNLLDRGNRRKLSEYLTKQSKLDLTERKNRINESKKLIKQKVIKLKKDFDARLRKSYELKIDKIIKSSRSDSCSFPSNLAAI